MRCICFILLGFFLLKPLESTILDTYYQWKSFNTKKVIDPNKIISFIKKHPHWPNKRKLLAQVEGKLTEIKDTNLLLSFFDRTPPQTFNGMIFYLDTLIQKKRFLLARKMIQECWISNKIFSISQVKIFREKYKKLIDKEWDCKRIDHLTYQENIPFIKEMIPFLSFLKRKQVESCLQLIEGKNKKLNKVFFNNDPKFMFHKIRFFRKGKKNKEAILLLNSSQTQKEEKKYPEHWWGERNILARRMIEEKKYKTAFDIIKNHQLTAGENFANAEWMMAWILLRYLGKPLEAAKRFEKFYYKVRSPISKSRGAFWHGESLRALKKSKEAIAWYKKAALHWGTFYGQMALERLGKQQIVSLTKPLVKSAINKKFNNRDFVKVIKEFGKKEPKELMQPFVTHLISLIEPAEEALLIDLYSRHSNHAAVSACKALSKQKVLLFNSCFPSLKTTTIPIQKRYLKEFPPSFDALSHAIIRQESRFDEEAISPAGAQGLMQMMPQTAEREKKKYPAIPFSFLLDKKTNLTFGMLHLSGLLKEFKGSLVLAIAAYNAGNRAVYEWINLFGDPRSKAVSVVDWIELIPYFETRNYVQRVLENFFIYHFQNFTKKRQDLLAVRILPFGKSFKN